MKNYQGLFVTSDVHNHPQALSEMYNYITNPKYNSYNFIFNGDFIDRGPTPLSTVELIKKLLDFPNFSITIGNHEQMLYSSIGVMDTTIEKWCELIYLWWLNKGWHNFINLFDQGSLVNMIYDKFFRQSLYQRVLAQDEDSIIEAIELKKFIISNLKKKNAEILKTLSTIYSKTVSQVDLLIDDIHIRVNHSGDATDAWAQFDTIDELLKNNKVPTIIGHWCSDLVYTDISPTKAEIGSYKYINRLRLYMIDNASCTNLVLFTKKNFI